MIIKKIKIKGLYGYLNKEIEFFDDENYLVGINGSGKSSIIKIISSFFTKDQEYFERLEFESIHITTEENEYLIRKNLKLDIFEPDADESDRIMPLALWNKLENEKYQKLYIEREKKYIELDDELSPEEKQKEAQEAEEKIKNKNYNIPKFIEHRFMEEIKCFSINAKTPNLDMKIFENYLKKDIGENTDIIDKILTEVNPVRDIKSVLNEIGRKNLQYCMGLNEVEKLEKKIENEENEEKQNELEKSKIEILNKMKSNLMTPKRIKSYLENLNSYLKDSHKKMMFEELEGYFKLSALSSEMKEVKIFENYSSLSSGERNLISLITKVYFKIEEDSVLLIDEPEESLHIAWQQKIIATIKEAVKGKRIQIIIATHSPNLTGKMIELRKFKPVYPYNTEENIDGN
ncbi:MAG: AAA family ATPase [Cetobacterium sp.]